MIDVEPLIAFELDRLLPLPDGSRADWADVTRRAGLSTKRRLPHGRLAAVVAALVVAAVSAVAVTTPVGAAIARGFDGFSARNSREPGTPAPPEAQQAFQQQNERTWSGFAPGTQLRRLIATDASGTSYTLYGFRSGDELCLQLAATGGVDTTFSHCVPLQALQSAQEPAVVVTADEPIFATPNVQAASATFGIASDGVTAVLVHADDGTHHALVASNAFLYVADHPKLGTRVRAVDAVARDGATVALPFQSAPYGTSELPQPPKGSPQGPSWVDRRVSGGTIGWVEQVESRGQPIPPAELDKLGPFLQRQGQPVLARLIQPDTNDSLRVGVLVFSATGSVSDPGATLCQMLFDRGAVSAGCGPIREFFAQRAISPGLSTASGGDQFTILSGLASDDVASMRVFLASGETIQVPLADNAFLARINRSAFPIRIVGYDDHGQVIDIETIRSAD
jgi:hypothetical protein